MLQWFSLSPDFNLTEMPWRDLKIVVHKRMPANVTKLKQRCKEESKFIHNHGKVLIKSYKLLNHGVYFHRALF